MPTSTGDILRIAARHKFRTVDDVVNVFHVGLNAPPTPNTNAALLADVAEYVGTAWQEIAAHLVNDLTAYDISVYNVTDDAPIGSTSWGGGYVGGTAAGEALPAAVACLVLMRTSVKRTQGRMYLGGMQEGDLVDSLWGGALIADVGLMIDMLINPTAPTFGTDFAFGILKRSDGLRYAVQSIAIQPIPAYQLRRKPGRGS